jgi:hypothetical protein
MHIWGKIVGPSVTALLVASPLGLPHAAASASMSCRNVSVSNSTGGAYVDAQLCCTPVGGGYFDMNWSGTVYDNASDGSGAAAQVKYNYVTSLQSAAYRTDGAGSHRPFFGGARPGKLLYMRACLINGSSVHHCSEWK